MAKTSIITRAFNRLEYTITCIKEVHRLAKNADYEHIIIDQASSDGTTEWLKSMEIEKYYKLKVKYNKSNTGDAGGMKDGFDLISNDCEYILQLDNDLIPLTDDFIQKLVNIMDNDKKIGSIMLKREGVSSILKTTKLYKTYDNVSLYYMNQNHGLFFRKSSLKEINYWVNKEIIGWVKHIPHVLKSQGLLVLKTPDIRVLHIDTASGQALKFPKLTSSKKIRKSNYQNFDYNNLDS